MSKWDKYKIDSDEQAPVSKWEKYRIIPEEPQEEPSSFLDRASQFAKGALSGFGRAALEEAANQAASGVMEIGRGVASPISAQSAQANIPRRGVESLESMRPKKDDSLGNILYHAGEFGGGVASFPMLPGNVANASGIKSLLSSFGKNIGSGAAIGGASGILQEGGLNPLAADIGATFVLPAGVAGIKSGATKTKNLLNQFTPKGRKGSINTEVANILKQRIGEQNIPSVLSKLEAEGPLGTNLPTAELADNAGLAGLHRALAPNIPAMAEKNIMNNALINKNLQALGNVELSPEAVGENIRNRLATNLQQATKTREQVTKPLYEKVNELKIGVELPNTWEFLQKEGKFAKGEIKKNIEYVKSLIDSNKPLQTNKKFGKLEGLSPSTLSQIQKEIVGAPLPPELTNAVKEISGRIGAAKKAGNNEVARILTLAKENILTDMAAIPEEQIARSTYASLSKPISAIEKEPLLKRFVKKDEFGKDYLLSPEKIPDLILNGTVNNTKALMKQLANNKNAINTVRGSVINKLISSTELSNAERNLSYDKVNKFLKKNQAKLDLIFEPEQIKVLEDTKEILRRRNMVQTLGRATGSNTQSETTLLNDLLGTGANKFLREAAAYNLPGGGILYDTIKQTFKESRTRATKELLEKALLDPKTATYLLTSPKKIRDKNSLNNILEYIYPKTAALTTSLTTSNNSGEEK